MDGYVTCPICSNKMRIKNNVTIKLKETKLSVTEKTCTQGMNHTFQVCLNNPKSKEPIKIKLSLDHRYSKFINIDFVNKCSRIDTYKNGKRYYLYLDKLIEPDFPDLENLKRKVNIYLSLT